MCDALAANTVGEAGELNTILAHCLAHARRRFVEVENRFPAEVEHLLGEPKFGLTATPIQQIWIESSALKSALFGQIRYFPLDQAVLPERHR